MKTFWSMNALKKAMKREPGRYRPGGWTVGNDFCRWSDRPAGEPAYLNVDDLHAQIGFAIRAIPEEWDVTEDSITPTEDEE